MSICYHRVEVGTCDQCTPLCITEGCFCAVEKPHNQQTILEGLLIMAYNCGRDHEKTQRVSIEEGRKRVVLGLVGFVSDADRGDLDDPIVDLLQSRDLPASLVS